MQSGIRSYDLHYWRWWCLLGLALVLIVIYLSLGDISMPQVSSTIGDKINHLIAYGTLMGWFGQLTAVWRHRLYIALALVTLGVSMEILQGMTDHRFFEWQDALANALGVLCGMVMLKLGADKILQLVEVHIIRRKA